MSLVLVIFMFEFVHPVENVVFEIVGIKIERFSKVTSTLFAQLHKHLPLVIPR